ncbi:hypothetical protein DESC_120055 [Desulfosarcina cetonica]|nr:hypothetical protein DESC_120055 [Desulfosarcina cetonica]
MPPARGNPSFYRRASDPALLWAGGRGIRIECQPTLNPWSDYAINPQYDPSYPYDHET